MAGISSLKLTYILIAYGIAGSLIFGAAIPYVYLSGGSDGISAPVEGEFKAMAETMDDASLAAANAAKSVRSAKDTLKAVGKAEKSANSALQNTGKTLTLGAETSKELAGGFTSVHQATKMLGISQFEDVSVKFNSFSDNLQDISKDITGISKDLSDVSKEIDSTADHLDKNADDMMKLSSDFKKMSNQLDDVSGKFSTASGGFSAAHSMMLLGLLYLTSLHAMIAVFGIILRDIQMKGV